MFTPAKDIQDSSTLRAFLTRCGLTDYESLVERADADPDWFWSQVIGLADIRFSRPYQTLRDVSGGPAGIRWAADATLNLTETCLDARIEVGLGEKAAIERIGEDGERRVWTYRDLACESARVASALAARGVGAGDAVGIYMPMVPRSKRPSWALRGSALSPSPVLRIPGAGRGGPLERLRGQSGFGGRCE
jgi:acetyl-CoA synthetase